MKTLLDFPFTSNSTTPMNHLKGWVTYHHLNLFWHIPS